MIERTRPMDRITTTMGLLCVLATLLLISPGVRTVRAEGGQETPSIVDPVLEAKHEVPAAAPAPADQSVTPGEPRAERPPGVRVLNTRGYNYGPPPGGVDPRSLALDAPPARLTP
jgi:hypothetical protein